MENLLLDIKDLSEELLLVDNYINEFLHTSGEMEEVETILNCVNSTRGKMIRPLLLLLAARFGPDYEAEKQRLCKMGALVEIVHMASLVHDDIIDDSPLRRGRPTIQQQFGKDMAVYAGDFMTSRVLRHLSAEQMNREGIIIGWTVEKMCRGELGQMSCRWNTETSVEEYLRNIFGKSAALFVAAAQLGGEGSGTSQNIVGSLTAIGEHLGYMFQMRDDLLDFISAESKEGKPVHKDFADGIYTLPVLYAFTQPSCGQRLREIARSDSTASGYGELLREMRQIVLQSGGIDFCRQQMENHAALAGRQVAALMEQEMRLGLGLGRLIEELLFHSDTYQVL
ncbi:MAG: polyprenyl synthetase family protein [Treponema sp.]|nr:polyprenyl synthetase family protein [Treponema sp.]